MAGSQVRAHGVAVLERSEDDELLGTALQLVQALRYEAAHDSPLAAFLVRRAVSNATLAILLHWCAPTVGPDSSSAPSQRCPEWRWKAWVCQVCMLPRLPLRGGWSWLRPGGERRRYLYVEWEDPVFGPRAAAVHKQLQEALCAAGDTTNALAGISAQMGLVAQLRHIANELKACALAHVPASCPLGT